MASTRAKKTLKVVAINTIAVLSILIAPALAFRLYVSGKTSLAKLTSQSTDQRAYYPTYPNKMFSIELLNEFSKVTTNYRSFLGWRSEKLNLKYTNISGPYNSRRSPGQSLYKSAWFFGGSTMWGTGASDNQTIPSHFHSKTNKAVYNFGENSWNSRQSLNQLINAIGDNHRPSAVIFYDGVNDVAHNCRSEYTLMPIHAYELMIATSLKGNSLAREISTLILSPYSALADRLETNYSDKYNCDTNKSKANSVADHLINNWRTAHSLSATHGFGFHAILQPTLFTTKTNFEYLAAKEIKRHPGLRRQFDAVYPLIREKMSYICKTDRSFCTSVTDGTSWLDGKENIYIDFCHINSIGNETVASKIALLVRKSQYDPRTNPNISEMARIKS